MLIHQRIRILVLLLCGTALRLWSVESEDRAENMLAEAWKEYEYQNFPAADRLFDRALEATDADAESGIQARLGKAMVVHFRVPGGNPGDAIALYQEVLADIGPDHKVTPNIHLLIGKAYRALDEPELDSARAYLEIVLSEAGGTIEADEAALETAYTHSYKQDRENFMLAIDFLQDYLSKNPGCAMASTMYLFCAKLFMHMKDYEKARENLIHADSLGVANLKYKPTVLFQIAYISEVELRDTATAYRYYRKLTRKHPLDSRTYFSELRVKAFEDIVKENAEDVAE